MNPLDSSSSAFGVQTPPIQTGLKNPKSIKNYTRELKIFCECAYDSKGTISSSDRSYCLCDWLCHALKTCFKVIYYWIFSFKRDPEKIEENQVNINTYKKQLMDTLELIMTKDSKEFEDKTTFHAYQWVLNTNLAKVQQLIDTSSGFNSTLKQENQLKLLKHGYEKAIQLFNDKHLQQQPELPGRVDISSNEIPPPTLKNIGNSCYMDSALQLLWLMRDELYVKIKLILTQPFNKNSEEFESYLKKISVAKALDVFYQACYSGQSDRIQDSLYKFRNLIFIGCLHPEFTPGHEHRQMDSYAFISLVLEALNGDEMLPSYEFKTADNHPLPVIKHGEKRYLKLNLGQNPNDPRTLQDLINENHTKEAFHWRIAENIDGINAQKRIN